MADAGTPRLGLDVRHPGVWLAAVTLVGAALRLQGLAGDLWLDEIATVVDVRAHGALELLTEYESANRHLLNSLAIAASTALFGETEWAVRLPAVLCGIASVPAIFALARTALGSRESLLVAFALATSYHHVYLSQNARGYAGAILGGLVATATVLADRGGGARSRATYVAAALFAVAAQPLAFFVLGGHALRLGYEALRGRGGEPGRWLAAPVAATAAGFVLYAPAWTHAIGEAAATYRSESFGAQLLSRENFAAWSAALSAGGSLPLPIVTLAAVAALTIWVLYARRQPRVSWLLVAPLVLQAGFVVATGLRTPPRFFFWAIPVALFHLIAVTLLIAEWRGGDRGRLWLPPFVAVGAAALSAVLLTATYGVPKQPNRRAMEALAADRSPDEVVVAVGLAKWGARYYGPRFGLEEGRTLFVVHSPAELRALEERLGGERLLVVTTFERALAEETPAFFAAIEREYPVERTLAASVGDGQLRLRRSRLLSSSDAPAP